MYTFRIKIGNIVAAVESNFSYIRDICEPYGSLEHPNCNICISKSDIKLERDHEKHTEAGDIGISDGSADWFLETYALLHKLLPILPEHNMLFMHGSAIDFKGKAYIFVAPSGTGKSTHTRLWKDRFGDEVTIINDDKPFLAFRDDKVYLCGTPWRGKHNIGQNLQVELGGICLLVRGPYNEICVAKPADVVNELIQQSNLHSYKHNTLKALDLVEKLLTSVPLYRLLCTPTVDAVDVCSKEFLR